LRRRLVVRAGQQSAIALLRVKTGAELLVSNQIRARGVQIYLPQYLVNLRRAGMVARALFPGYVFVWVVDQWRMLLQLIHVYDFLRTTDKEITYVDPCVVKKLQARQGPTGYIRIDAATFLVGQPVKLRHGPDLAGTYLGLSDDYKARVLFTMLGHDLHVELFESDLVSA
jgi:transcription antitermination factor NusG